jgi:hypothetical protein
MARQLYPRTLITAAVSAYQTGQESRSAGLAAANTLTGMDITIYSSFLRLDDPDASLAFYRDTLGFEVRNDVGNGAMRWITVGPAGNLIRVQEL